MDGREVCSVDECETPVERAGLCGAHYKRKRLGHAPHKLARPRGLERLTEAALAYAGAEDDETFRKARDNLRKSAIAYARLVRPALVVTREPVEHGAPGAISYVGAIDARAAQAAG
jgi:hypothetical protein